MKGLKAVIVLFLLLCVLCFASCDFTAILNSLSGRGGYRSGMNGNNATKNDDDSKETDDEDHHSHSFVLMVAGESQLASEATCVSGPKYYYSCSCGEISGSEVFVRGDSLGHVLSRNTEFYTTEERIVVATVPSDSVRVFFRCSRCEENVSMDYKKDSGKHSHIAHSYTLGGDGLYHATCAICRVQFTVET